MSYRRSDVSGYSGRITDALAAQLGARNVFHDVTAIAAGRDFQDQIDRSLAGSDAVLAIIGLGWLTASTPEGQRRLFQPDDVVRIELARALSTDIPVVPVLVGGAELPIAEDLPEDLRELATRQAVVLRDESFHQDIDRLLRSLRGEPSDPAESPRRSRRRTMTAAAAAALTILIIGGVTWWIVRDQSTGQGSGSSEPTGCPEPSGAGWHQVPLAARPSATLRYPDGGSLTFTVNAANWRLGDAGDWQIVLSTQMQNNTTGNHAHGYWYYRNIRVARRPFTTYCFDRVETDAAAGEIADASVGFNVTCPPNGSMVLVLETSTDNSTELPFTEAATPGNCAPTP